MLTLVKYIKNRKDEGWRIGYCRDSCLAQPVAHEAEMGRNFDSEIPGATSHWEMAADAEVPCY